MHIHKWKAWTYAGTVFKVPPGKVPHKAILFEAGDLEPFGTWWEIGCWKCDKIKGRVELDGND